MSPSKLEKYLNILDVLVEQPQGIDRIMAKVHMDQKELKPRLNFLVFNGVVDKRSVGRKKVVYALNDRGLSVFKTLRAFQYFEKLKDSLPIVEEAREIASLMSKHSSKWKEEQ